MARAATGPPRRIATYRRRTTSPWSAPWVRAAARPATARPGPRRAAGPSSPFLLWHHPSAPHGVTTATTDVTTMVRGVIPAKRWSGTRADAGHALDTDARPHRHQWLAICPEPRPRFAIVRWVRRGNRLTGLHGPTLGPAWHPGVRSRSRSCSRTTIASSSYQALVPLWLACEAFPGGARDGPG